MDNLVVSATPPTMDNYAPEFCFCGKRTVKSHEFWFCSTKCARQDSLRSLDDPECHYRNVVRKAYVQAGVPDLYPRRMMSVDQLRSLPFQQRAFVDAPPRIPPPMSPSCQGNVAPARRAPHDLHMAGFPTLAQVTGRVLIRKASAGEKLVAERRDRPRFQDLPNASSRVPVQAPLQHTFEQISLDVIPFPDDGPVIPVRPLRRVPSSSDCLRTSFKKSVTALLNIGQARKDKEGERVFGHPVNDSIITPPVRKESLPSYRAKALASAASAKGSKGLRRSASFAGWNATPHGSSHEQGTVMQVIKEMREGSTESFDPKALFDLEEHY